MVHFLFDIYVESLNPNGKQQFFSVQFSEAMGTINVSLSVTFTGVLLRATMKNGSLWLGCESGQRATFQNEIEPIS